MTSLIHFGLNGAVILRCHQKRVRQAAQGSHEKEGISLTWRLLQPTAMKATHEMDTQWKRSVSRFDGGIGRVIITSGRRSTCSLTYMQRPGNKKKAKKIRFGDMDIN